MVCRSFGLLGALLLQHSIAQAVILNTGQELLDNLRGLTTANFSGDFIFDPEDGLVINTTGLPLREAAASNVSAGLRSLSARNGNVIFDLGSRARVLVSDWQYWCLWCQPILFMLACMPGTPWHKIALLSYVRFTA